MSNTSVDEDLRAKIIDIWGLETSPISGDEEQMLTYDDANNVVGESDYRNEVDQTLQLVQEARESHKGTEDSPGFNESDFHELLMAYAVKSEEEGALSPKAVTMRMDIAAHYNDLTSKLRKGTTQIETPLGTGEGETLREQFRESLPVFNYEGEEYHPDNPTLNKLVAISTGYTANHSVKLIKRIEDELLDRSIALDNEETAVKWDDIVEVLTQITNKDSPATKEKL